MSGQRIPERLLHDAVIVVPGIMGSELREVESGKQLWGVRELFGYSARMHSARLRALAVTDDERAGDTGRVEATNVLSVAEWLPGFGAAQPYNSIIKDLQRAAVHRGAVMAFPYDWRLSVAHNGGLLANAARRHLEVWRAHPAHRDHLRRNPEAGPARVLFVAHSMGGLLVRELLAREAIRQDVRAVLTVGTPFSGSVKAAIMLNSGTGTPIPLSSKVLREVTPTMPGLYDLLPSYRALQADLDMRTPTEDDLVALGGQHELVRESLRWRQSRGEVTVPRHSIVVGFGQRTLQSYRMESGKAVGQEFMFVRDNGHGRVLRGPDDEPRREDRGGDGTVYRFAAHLPGSAAEPIPVSQEHTALIRSRTVADLACGMLRGLRHPDELGVVLGDGQLALDAPEWAEPGTSFDITVTGWDGLSAPQCVVREVSGRDEVLYPELKAVRGEEGTLAGTCSTARPGLYEVEVVGGREPVFRLVLVVASERDD